MPTKWIDRGNVADGHRTAAPELTAEPVTSPVIPRRARRAGGDLAAGVDAAAVDPRHGAESPAGTERDRRPGIDTVEGDRLATHRDEAAGGRIAEVDAGRRRYDDIAAGDDRVEPGGKARDVRGEIIVGLGVLDAGNPRCQNDVAAVALVVEPGAAAEGIADRQVAAVADANIVAGIERAATLTAPTAVMPRSLPAVGVPVAEKIVGAGGDRDIGSGGDRRGARGRCR